MTRAYVLLDSHTAPCYVILCMSTANATIWNVSWHSVRDERKLNQSYVGINWKPEVSIGTLNARLYWN